MSTLLESGFSADELGLESLEIVAGYLQRQLAVQKGVVGFGKQSRQAASSLGYTVLLTKTMD